MLCRGKIGISPFENLVEFPVAVATFYFPHKRENSKSGAPIPSRSRSSEHLPARHPPTRHLASTLLAPWAIFPPTIGLHNCRGGSMAITSNRPRLLCLIYASPPPNPVEKCPAHYLSLPTHPCPASGYRISRSTAVINETRKPKKKKAVINKRGTHRHWGYIII